MDLSRTSSGLASNWDSLGAQVVNVIRDRIFRGELKQGQQVQESVLADQLGVSRGPVRDAMTVLEHEGLILWVPRKSPAVVTLTARDAEEIYTLRKPLEELAIRLATQRRTTDDIVRMNAAVDAMREAFDTGDLIDLSLRDVAFHDMIYQAADHRRLLDAWLNIRSQVVLFLVSRNTLAKTDQKSAILEHQQLVDAIAARTSTSELKRLVGVHLKESFQRLVLSLPSTSELATQLVAEYDSEGEE